MSDSDPTLWQIAGVALTALWAGVVAVGSWVWKHTWGVLDKKTDMNSHRELEKRVSVMEATCIQKTEVYHAKLEGKADARELDRQRNNIDSLFAQQTEIRKEMNAGFEDVQKSMNNTTVMLLSAISDKK